MERRPLIGIVAALGVSLTAGIALPFVNLLKGFMVGELMVVRGFIAALLVLLISPMRQGVVRPTKRTILFCILITFGTVGLYEGIRSWGPSLTLVVLTTQPIVNFLAKRLRGERISLQAFIALVVLLVGVILALQPWKSHLEIEGFLWSFGATVSAGIGVEVMRDAQGKQRNAYSRTFWLAVTTVSIGILSVFAHSGHVPFYDAAMSAGTLATLIIWGLIGGFLYYLSIVLAYTHLPTDKASVLAMGETPFVILAAGFLLGEWMAVTRWAGVLMAVGATIFLGLWEARKAQASRSLNS